MPPKRRVPNRIPVEEANERDRVAQLEQQMAQITEQLATLLANQNPNQNPFQALNPNGGDVEDESDEEESDPSLFYDETCLSKEVFADLDLPPVFDEEVFDKESMIADLDLPPVFDEEIVDKESMSADFDPKLELVEEECHAAKVDKEASLGIGDQSAPKFNNIGVVDSGNTAEEHGSAMVVRLVCSAYLSKIRGRIFSNLERMMQPSKTIWQTKVWISWSGGIDSKTKGAKRRKQKLGMVLTVRMGKFRGPFQRVNELKINIIICFRKAQDEPYKCYEDSVLWNRSQQAHIRPFRLLREDLSWTRAGNSGLDEMIRAELRGPLQRAYRLDRLL